MEPERIAKLLPELYRAELPPGNLRDAVLEVMSALHVPAEAALAELDRFFDPRRAGDGFIEMLAGWVALDPYLNVHDWEDDGRRGRVAIDAAQLRDLTARAAVLARERGTQAAFVAFLELATGVRGFVVEAEPVGADGRRMPFHVRVRAPAGARDQEALVTLILRREKPAFTTIELVWATAPS